MKSHKLFIALFLLLSRGLSATNEVKIHRAGALKQVAAGLMLGCIGIVPAAKLAYEVHKENLAWSTDKSIIAIALGTLSLAFIAKMALSAAKQYSLKDKPKLIFDQEGFTYEHWVNSGIFSLGEPQDVRYLWKDVLSMWTVKTSVNGITTNGNTR